MEAADFPARRSIPQLRLPSPQRRSDTGARVRPPHGVPLFLHYSDRRDPPIYGGLIATFARGSAVKSGWHERIFSGELDRAAFIVYFLGAVVPLIGFALVIDRFALPYLEDRD